MHHRATYHTLGSHRADLFLPSSFLSPFPRVYFFIFSPILSIAPSFFFPFRLISSSHPFPAVLPPFVPALHAEDDTSNFEEPEQAAPWPASAAQHEAQPAGFKGQDLPFLGWFFSRALTTLAKTE